jgi:hypothetical protein
MQEEVTNARAHHLDIAAWCPPQSGRQKDQPTVSGTVRGVIETLLEHQRRMEHLVLVIDALTAQLPAPIVDQIVEKTVFGPRVSPVFD